MGASKHFEYLVFGTVRHALADSHCDDVVEPRIARPTSTKIESTEAGAALAARIARALDLVRAAVDDCRSAAEPLRVTAVPTFATRWLTPRLPAYHARADAVPLALDVSVDLRAKEAFDVAVRTGLGGWPGLEVIPLMPLEATPMLSPALAATAKLSAPEDLAALPLLQHEDWPRWFREAGCGDLDLRFYADEYPTHDLNAAAAVEGAGVALLSPTIFGPLVREGKLIQPFPRVMLGPAWHFILLNSGEARPAVRGFCAWLEEEARSAAGS